MHLLPAKASHSPPVCTSNLQNSFSSRHTPGNDARSKCLNRFAQHFAPVIVFYESFFPPRNSLLFDAVSGIQASAAKANIRPCTGQATATAARQHSYSKKPVWRSGKGTPSQDFKRSRTSRACRSRLVAPLAFGSAFISGYWKS